MQRIFLLEEAEVDNLIGHYGLPAGGSLREKTFRLQHAANFFVRSRALLRSSCTKTCSSVSLLRLVTGAPLDTMVLLDSAMHRYLCCLSPFPSFFRQGAATLACSRYWCYFTSLVLIHKSALARADEETAAGGTSSHGGCHQQAARSARAGG